MIRPAISSKRLERLSDGRIRYRLRRAFHDGTRAILFDPLTFIGKLCTLVPPPRANLLTYHGVLAPNAAWRSRVVPRSEPGSPPLRKRCQKTLTGDTPAPERERRYTWAQLMKRVFKLDVLQCPICSKGRRKLIAFITEAEVIRAILACLDLPADPPHPAPARWPP